MPKNDILLKNILKKVNRAHRFRFVDLNGSGTPMSIANFVFSSNQFYSLSISSIEIDYIIKNSDLKRLDESGSSPAVLAFMQNRTEGLNLKKSQIDYLIKNSDIAHKNEPVNNIFLAALKNNKVEGLNLTESQFDYLIDNSDLKQYINNEWDYLTYALHFNKRANAKLTPAQFDKFIENYDFSRSRHRNSSLLETAIIINNENNITIKIIEEIIKRNKNIKIKSYFSGGFFQKNYNQSTLEQFQAKLRLLLESVISRTKIEDSLAPPGKKLKNNKL